MEPSLVETLLKSGGAWAAALVIVCVYFVGELRKNEKKSADVEARRVKELAEVEARRVKELAEAEAKHKEELDKKVQTAVDFSTQKQITELQVQHAARVQELNTAMINMQAEHSQHRLRDHEEFRKALLTREQEVINALNASSVASEEQSKTMEQLRDALMNAAHPILPPNPTPTKRKQ